eukprot:TRINITY_DN78307_c0_g1_i1.p1 TRINITY_DN78307_c0_g1~~TRINITY_DN78307_c0_g1_i1.p1  ORF type:complete len:438 (-),score=88.39 TRINITY_DN78307_c0_g1_i1:64-1377(-)
MFKAKADKSKQKQVITLSSRKIDHCWKVVSTLEEGKDFSKVEFIEAETRNAGLRKLLENSRNAQLQSLDDLELMTLDSRNAARNEMLKLVLKVLKLNLQENGSDLIVTNNAEASSLRLLGCEPSGFVRLNFQVSESFFGYSFEELYDSHELQTELEFRLRSLLAKELYCDVGELVVLEFVKGSIWVEMAATNECFERAMIQLRHGNRVDLRGCGVPDGLLNMMTPDRMELVELVTCYLRHRVEELGVISNLTGEVMRVVTVLSLSPSDFDVRGDFHFPCPDGEQQWRGGSTYYQPSSEWKRVGLRVTDIYPDGNGWLSMNGQEAEWAVAFHGVSGNVNALRSIVGGRQIMNGFNNAYGGGRAANRSDSLIPSPGIYFSQEVTTCYHSAISIDGAQYNVAFQCRVHPRYIWETGYSRWIVVDAPYHVRPYGIVLKRVS